MFFTNNTIRYYSFSKIFLASVILASSSAPIVGYFRFRLASFSATILATIARIIGLLSAGITYHGASFQAVFYMASRHACLYFGQSALSFISLELKFQFFFFSSILDRKRAFCSSCPKFKKYFKTTVPFFTGDFPSF